MGLWESEPAFTSRSESSQSGWCWSTSPSLLPERLKRDAAWRPPIERVWLEGLRINGARKIWRRLEREQVEVARGTSERLMRQVTPSPECRLFSTPPRTPIRAMPMPLPGSLDHR